jgi:N-acyl-D-aspartate/D-glutamate deacylase
VKSCDFDIVIRRGMLADGLGGEPYEADIAVAGGWIVAVGTVGGRGREELDAHHLLVTPGFVDIHTHLDGHVTWARSLIPSSLHGVTTAVFGNCGVGFAPCRAEDRERLVRLMEGVEDIPEPVLTAGLMWDWTSFPEYLDSLAGRVYDMDVASQLPHGPLRLFVMGERAVRMEPATTGDVDQMAELATQAMHAGAIGFSTSRSINHRASDGSPTPSLKATEAELIQIAIGLKAAGRGVIQLISDFEDVDAEFDIVRHIAQASGRPISLTLLQLPHAPDRWRELLSRIERANDEGLTIKGQVCGRPVGALSGFEITFCPFSFCPTYQQLADLPFDQKVQSLRNPETRRQILDEFAVPLAQRQREIANATRSRTVDLRSMAKLLTNFEMLFPVSDPPDYEPSPDKSVSAIAARRGILPAAIAYEWMLENDGRGLLYGPASNFSDHTLDAARQMLVHRDTVLGLSDAGAHCSVICDATFSTYMLTHWARDRTDGIPLGQVVQALTSSTASTVRLFDRGVIRPGYRADMNVIDPDRLRLHAPRVAYDLPNGGKRLVQDATGYCVTLVNGVVTYRDGISSGAFPGRLIRMP